MNPRARNTRPANARQMNARPINTGQNKSHPAGAGQTNAGKVHKRAFDMDAAAKAAKAAKSMAGAARDLDSAGADSRVSADSRSVDSRAGAKSSLDSRMPKSSKNTSESKSRTPHKSQSHKSQMPYKSSESRATSPKHTNPTKQNPRQNNSAQGIPIGIISALEIARFSDHGAYLIMPKAQNIAESKILNADFLDASVLDSGKKDSSANARAAKSRASESRVFLKNAIPNFASHQITEVLLPQKFCTPQMQVGDIVPAFVYTDSLDRPVATTQTPFATLGELAFLRVVSIASNGLFLDLGIDKDIFMPSKNAQKYAPESTTLESASLDSSVDSAPKIAVYISLDKSGRLIAKRGIKEALAPYKIAHEGKAQAQRGKKVKILPYEVSPLGVSCVVEGRYYGLIYATDSKCAQNTLDISHFGLEIGKEGVAFIQKVREDGRLDLTLRSASSAKSDAQKILERLRENGGRLGVHYDSSPESINALFGISKKALKRALTELLKAQKITLIPQKEIILK
ncbi:hypothetical protein BKN38_00845 [Helicobacter sp. CLO-3]|uniref:CvfB family protein n=1 Tax=unclassified Helicobacter TaxID=2593540 RepID=UPI000805099B|nr:MULTISPECIES: S1-like domain-containing RNA-binding protein [unclassified Helicobacter]OBV29631.1 hypothetical protein BA723_04680 [Helicobacter sp. CLO-3]OHU85601.1 hypothetical protein BKN38_00845 [Helicobacter sp. CLO-3]